MNPLILPYLANILILLPVGPGSLWNLWPVADGRFPESAGWRTITGSLWTAILLGSVYGLFQPVIMAPLLVLQVIYKTLWLLTYVAPRLGDPARRREIHPAISLVFLGIVLTWPMVIPWAALAGKAAR